MASGPGKIAVVSRGSRSVPEISRGRLAAFPPAVVLTLVAGTAAAYAHGTGRGLVMLLPTAHYMVASALAVAASFLLLSCFPDAWLSRFAGARLHLAILPRISPFWPSMLSFAVMVFLVVAGFLGTGDPLGNPLPLSVWTLWWVGFTSLQFFTGNLWKHLNPWSGPVALCRRLQGLARPFPRLPKGLGYWPAVAIFALFAWLELVDPAPEDPHRLAWIVLGYWFATLAAILVFGERAWFERAEPFAIFFRLVGACSPLRRESTGGGEQAGRTRIELVAPGTGLLALPTLPVSGILFIVLTLGSVSFDGFSKTFLWLGIFDINPLEFPGRTAMTGINSFGLLAMFALWSGALYVCVSLGCLAVRRPDAIARAVGRLVYSIVPISLVFHMAHYLTVLLVNGQYVALALNDPLGRGSNLLGLEGYYVTTSFLTNYGPVSVIWNVQTALIVCGHVIGVFSAHLIARRLFASAPEAARSQVFLATLMVSYTLFGLWLLSTPAIG